ncbi:Pr6Pr family membrane protein [Williamsoniiplasma luminosum]|nr:Pr6Pr family membrane protein [Williamsoniiplasma luminosum]
MKLNINKSLLYLKDWKFIFKLTSFIICVLLIITGIIWGCFIDQWYVDKNSSYPVHLFPTLYGFNVLISFWSVQTNLLVLLWFGFAVFGHGKEHKNKFINRTSQTNITIYITTTMLLFWGVIVLNILGDASEYDFATKTASDVAITSLTHLLTPLLMIVYYVLTMGQSTVSWKRVWTLFVYPSAYCIFLVIRAEMLTKDGIKYFLYPYSFTNFSQPLFGDNLALSNFVCILVLAILLLVFFLLFVLTNNYVYKRKHKANQPIETN